VADQVAVTPAALEFRRLQPDLTAVLADFFREFAASPETAFFHPHPFTDDEAARICAHAGRDLYYAACAGGRVLAYGLLRGWDDGHAIPSLGIVLASAARGRGLAPTFMAFLHAAAKQRGATQIRLTVYRDNARAVELYRRLGYQLEPKNEQELVGLLAL
jgi:ribosomal protein S18 acetylase RimI-like enzyme